MFPSAAPGNGRYAPPAASVLTPCIGVCMLDECELCQRCSREIDQIALGPMGDA
ncbi:DUF1289 domain-containing protein [Luteimonas sp. Y-2-2-4F]|nr:DUF1289 domain-containing protein [Luteimonas sp. Y-2-2-4F]MCD9031865.1 DUF1289 domain-containing protein [Luteimonas sp. Y-2-2-4F]